MDLVSRAKGILLTPRSEWVAIESEPATVAGLYAGYIVPLAAIPAVAHFIRFALIGTFGYRMPVVTALSSSVVTYVLALISTYIFALVINALAPTFGGEKNQIQALKVAAYSSTASWLAGAFQALPIVSILALLGFYSLYLLYLGLPILMKSPQEKSMGYTVVVIICAIVLYIVVGAITTAVIGTAALGMGTIRP